MLRQKLDKNLEKNDMKHLHRKSQKLILNDKYNVRFDNTREIKIDLKKIEQKITANIGKITEIVYAEKSKNQILVVQKNTIKHYKFKHDV